MKNTLYTLLFCFALLSCTDSDDARGADGRNPKPDPSAEIPKLGFSINASEGNIFELMEFNLLTDREVSLYELNQAYDSVTWEISGIEGSYKILGDNPTGGSSFVWKWSQTFFLVANHEAYLFCYKDNKIIDSDTVRFTIKDDKDFLGFKWEEITTGSRGSTGYNDSFAQTNFTAYYEFEQNAPSITLFRWYDRSEKEDVFAKNSKKVLRDYIVSLYSSEPEYKEGDSKLQEKYEELFVNNRVDYTPLCIWLTPKARVVLVEYRDEYASYTNYRIYAESNMME